MAWQDEFVSERAQAKKTSFKRTPEFIPSTDKREIILCSEPVKVWRHYVGKRSVACSNDDYCKHCWKEWDRLRREGDPDWHKKVSAALRAYFFVLYNDELCWIEVGPPAVKSILKFSEVVGIRVRCWKTGRSQQSQILFESCGSIRCARQDGTKFFGSTGFCQLPERISQIDYEAYMGFPPGEKNGHHKNGKKAVLA